MNFQTIILYGFLASFAAGMMTGKGTAEGREGGEDA